MADNPVGFIPDELTRLLEKTFTWSISFTDSTTDSDKITFQVNAIVGEANDGGAVIPATPGASQTSSTMSSLLAAPEPSLPSKSTPTKLTLDVLEPADTPQSTRNNAHDQVLVYI